MLQPNHRRSITYEQQEKQEEIRRRLRRLRGLRGRSRTRRSCHCSGRSARSSRFDRRSRLPHHGPEKSARRDASRCTGDAGPNGRAHARGLGRADGRADPGGHARADSRANAGADSRTDPRRRAVHPHRDLQKDPDHQASRRRVGLYRQQRDLCRPCHRRKREGMALRLSQV